MLDLAENDWGNDCYILLAIPLHYNKTLSSSQNVTVQPWQVVCRKLAEK